MRRDLTRGLQYYIELMMSHGEYLVGSPAGAPVADELRHTVTTRMRWTALRQRLQLSLFAFASPSDRDGYLRASRLRWRLDLRAHSQPARWRLHFR